ncbi:MAG: hypothetical protein Gaeavirus8_5 [Gaeavirus sp.]|uniref:MORN repeat-containing protein n=1 Tax=Gaeavirus sp. TaxID=2487767 RepID=A0A3G5A0R0_9VIRU|nr:MAG: hypothetical protein Gaeavirus8_5 [Gaeavirus sp.]
MDTIKTLYHKYISNEQYIYASSGKYIIILIESPDALINDNTAYIVNPLYALYHTNKAQVISVFDKTNPSSTIKILQHNNYKQNIYRNDNNSHIITFESGKTTIDSNCTKYDITDILITRGIKYFKSIERAYLYNLLEHNTTFSGLYKEWDHTGTLRTEIQCLHGKRHGIETTYITNNSIPFKRSTTTYSNGIQSGIKTIYFPDNKICRTITFKDNKEHGLATSYFKSGSPSEQSTYDNGIQSGPYTKYYITGEPLETGVFADNFPIPGTWKTHIPKKSQKIE